MAGAKKGKGSRQSRQEWQSLLAKFDERGWGVGTFCRRGPRLMARHRQAKALRWAPASADL